MTVPRGWCAALSLVVCTFSTTTFADAAGYTVIDLGTLEEGNSILVRALNNNSEAAGASVSGAGPRGFVVGKGRIDRIPVFAGSDHGSARGINDSGEIVGSSNTQTSVRAFRTTRGGALQELPPLPGDTASEAFAINASGQAVGFSSGPNGVTAVVWPRNGAGQSLGRLPGGRDSRALAVNDRGDIVGSARTGASLKHAFIWSNGRMTDLGTLPGDEESEAFGVNNTGDVVGTSTGAGRTHAVLWRNGVPQDLGTLPGGFISRAMSINDRGDVVGTSSLGHDLHAFVWTPGSGMQDLNALVPPSSFILMEASAVNARGVILAIGRDGSADDPHDHHAEFPVRVFLLEPQP